MRAAWRSAVFVAGLAAGAGVWAQSVPPVKAVAAPVGKSAEPLVFYTGTGQFEIIALKAEAAQEALRLANSVWRGLAGPLSLPKEGFSSAVAVRLVPEAEWVGPAVFAVVAEPGGLVNVRVRWSDTTDARVVRRALTQAVILRRAVAWHGAINGLTVPLWLEQACAAWSEAADRPAMLDAMQRESDGMSPPTLAALLSWQRGDDEPRGWVLASFWLLQHFQAESGDSRLWPEWLSALLAGTDPLRALPAVYGTVLKDAATRELWWQVGYYNKSRSSALPLLTADDTRNWLADRCRWLAIKDGREQVLSLDDLWVARQEAWVKAELTERSHQLQLMLSRLHPFYRNAAISMGLMYQSALKGDEEQFKAAEKALSQDASDGRELEAATGSALDELEAGGRAGGR